jgi:CheY-like chemotaxis protein
MRELLELHDAKVVCATNGVKPYQVAKQSEFDLVISDVNSRLSISSTPSVEHDGDCKRVVRAGRFTTRGE